MSNTEYKFTFQKPVTTYPNIRYENSPDTNPWANDHSIFGTLLHIATKEFMTINIGDNHIPIPASIVLVIVLSIMWKRIKSNF